MADHSNLSDQRKSYERDALEEGDAATPRFEERVCLRRGRPRLSRSRRLLSADRDFRAWQQHALAGEVVRYPAADGRCMTILPVAGARDVVGLLVLGLERMGLGPGRMPETSPIAAGICRSGSLSARVSW